MTEERVHYAVSPLPKARANPLPYWTRQLEEVVTLNAGALERGYGLTVVLTVRPGGKIEAAKYTGMCAKKET